MLQFIRDRATGWIAWGIIILICVPFALWGIYDYLSPSRSVAVATVNGQELSYGQYQQAFQRHRARLQQLLGQSFNVNQIDESVIRQQSIETMVNDEVIVQAARRDGLRISDTQLARAIHAQEPFKRDGVFAQDYYEGWLRTQGYSPGGFEFDLRRSLLSEQLLSGVGGSAFATEIEKQRLYALMGQKRTYETLVIPVSRYAERQVSEADIAAHFKNNPERFLSAEEADIEFVVLSVDDLTDQIPVDDAEVLALYESNKLNFTKPEQRQARHILLRLARDASETEVDVAMEQMREIRAKLDGGESFADLAQAYSADTGSAVNGGDLGFFERGRMVPEFDSAVFSMQKGDISEPVRTDFGLHLIQLTEIDPSTTRSFDEVREEVVQDYRRTQAEQLYFERVEALANLAFEVPGSLEPAAEELGLQVQHMAKLTREGIPGNAIGSDPGVIEAAFADDVLFDGNNSDIVQLPENRVAVVRVRDHRPSRPLTLEETRPRIVAELTAEQARGLAASDGEAMLSELEAGGDPQALAEAYGLKWQTHHDVARGSSPPAPEVASKVFEMPRPGDQGPVFAGLETAAGDYVLVGLLSVTDGDPQTMTGEEKARIANELVGDYGRVAYDAYVKSLRAEAEVSVDEEAVRDY